MKLENKTYDILKWVAQILLPALSVLYLGLSKFWPLPSPEAISGTIMTIDFFLGTLLGISTSNYNKSLEDGGE